MLGWYLADKAETLRYGDGRKIEVGMTHKVDCEPVLCKQGLHASKTVLNALRYAPGSVLYRVRLGGKIIHGDDKSVATERTYIARIDAELILRKFARECALQVVHFWHCPRIVQEYLETGNEELRAAAETEALAAELTAASGAASVAARAAASAAELTAASGAARAAWAAAEAEAWAAADAEALTAELTASRDARAAAARNAASKKQSSLLEETIRTAEGNP